jgi:hypothetical protein
MSSTVMVKGNLDFLDRYFADTHNAFASIENPPHSLHWSRRRLCSQIPLPPVPASKHSLHINRKWLCSQNELPPHSLQRDRGFLCSHNPPPPIPSFRHSLQMERFLPCSHT